MKISILAVTLAAVVLSGCADATNQRLDAMNNQMDKLNKQIDADQEHIKTLDANSSRVAKESEAYEELLRSLVLQAERIAQTMEQFQKIGENFSQQLQNTVKNDDKNDSQAPPSTPPQSPNGVSPAPKAPPTAVTTNQGRHQPVRTEPVGPQIRLNEGFCVSKSVHGLYDQITNYDNYYKMPGSKYNVSGVGVLIEMLSSGGDFSFHTNEGSSADVAIVLRPLTINDPKMYPKLVMHCDSKWSSDKVFEHQCFLDQSKYHFSLSNLISHLKAEAGGCDKGQTRVTYQLSLQTDEKEVAVIKDKVVANFKLFGPIIARFFNEELFFKAYFRNLYNSWIQSKD